MVAAGGRDGDELEIDLRSVETVARWVAGFAPDVAVLAPPELAVAVRRSWAHALAAHLDGAPDTGPAPSSDAAPDTVADAAPVAGAPVAGAPVAGAR